MRMEQVPKRFTQIVVFHGDELHKIPIRKKLPDITHKIHVWFIDLHLVDFYGKFRYTCHTWICGFVNKLDTS